MTTTEMKIRQAAILTQQPLTEYDLISINQLINLRKMAHQRLERFNLDEDVRSILIETADYAERNIKAILFLP